MRTTRQPSLHLTTNLDSEVLGATLRRRADLVDNQGPVVPPSMVTKQNLKEIRRDLGATVKLELAPIAKPAGALPETWRRALAASDPIEAVFDEVWKPAVKLLPKTVKLFRKTTLGIALATANEQPPSLVYIATGDGDTYGRRGYPARTIPKQASRGVHADFLALYAVHDGWLDLHDAMGWLPFDGWRPLGSSGPSANFLVTLEGHGPGVLGFDLDESPPKCWTVWNDDPPDRVKNIPKTIDDWLIAQYEDLDVRGKPRG